MRSLKILFLKYVDEVRTDSARTKIKNKITLIL